MAAAPSRRVPVILDCDPGHDDALAIMLACGSPLADLRLVTTVGGNVPVSSTTANAVRFLHACGRPDVPVVQGASRPLFAEAVACHEIHGKTGMDGFEHWPPLDAPVPGGASATAPREGQAGPAAAVEAMADELVRAAGEARRSGGAMPVLVATGPLTNVALLLRSRPDVVTGGSLTRIVIMGGSTGLGNTSPAAEFNIEVDPHAAAVVLGAARPGAFGAEAAAAGSGSEGGLEVTMVPLDVTHTALVTPAVLDRVRAVRGRRGAALEGWSWRGDESSDFPRMLEDLVLFFGETYDRVFGFKDGPPVHDPCAMLAALRPSALDTRPCRVLVETSGLCAGRTVVDVLGITPTGAAAAAEAGGGAASFRGSAGEWSRAPVVSVALGMDVDAFWSELLGCAAACDARSPLSLAPE